MIPGFDMNEIAEMLPDWRDQIDEQLFDLLESFSEFITFKEMMLSFKKVVIASTPKHKSSKAAELEKEMMEKENIQIMEGLELLHISGDRKRLFDEDRKEPSE